MTGTIALVTGGSRGIGLAIAEALAVAGAGVAITGRDRAQLARAKARFAERSLPEPLALEADVREASQAAQAVDETAAALGGLDVLINNAGVGVFAPVADMTVDQWRQVLETNLSGVFYCCRAAVPRLRARGGGWIVNVSSLASTSPFAGGAAYCASKAGLNAFTEALMHEVRHDNIRVSVVLPGSVATGFGGRGERGAAEWKLAPADVAAVVLDLLRHPARSLPSRVELRPSKPMKG